MANILDQQQVSAIVAPSPPPQQEDEDQAEPFEIFVCQICLDIAYKPIVLQGCGHVFCFWCVRRSMNETKPSHCPACRRAYLHFPRVCRLLHFLLEKAWPLHYQRKATETQAMEKTTAIFSPRILPLQYSPSCSSSDSYTHSCVARGHCRLQDVEVGGGAEGHSDASNAGSVEAARKLHVYPELATEAAESTEVMSVSVEDVTCRACSRLLFRPVVINCGEVLCEWCWEQLVARSNPGSCSWCGGVHPRAGPARVCLPLHHFLERSFPTLYSQRQLATHPPGEKEKIQVKDDIEDMEEDEGFVHVGVGCDGCGMFPIVGCNRYHCVECGEHVGYDLCQSCYDLDLHAAKDNPPKISGESPKCGRALEAAVLEDEGSIHDDLHSTSPTSVLLMGMINKSSVNHSYGRFDQRHSAKHQMVVMVSMRRALPATFNAVLRFIQSHAPPLHFDLQSGTISRRRRSRQQIMDDFDDYIDSLV